jgi:hypothetical protein
MGHKEAHADETHAKNAQAMAKQIAGIEARNIPMAPLQP